MNHSHVHSQLRIVTISLISLSSDYDHWSITAASQVFFGLNIILLSSDPLVIREVLDKFILVVGGPPPPVRQGVGQSPAGVLASPGPGSALRLTCPVSDDEVEDGETGDTQGEKYQGEEERENRPAMIVSSEQPDSW